ncbi:MAG: GtrA family protein [Alphaproteobacteria bacterium]|jgi:putative flippase GtrA
MVESGRHGGRIVRFGVVGVAKTAIDFALFALLYYVALWPLLAANAVAYGVAVINSYVLNKYWTFGDTSRGRTAVLRGLLFVALNLVGLGLASAAIWLLAQFLHPLVAKAGSIAVTFTWNYWSNHRFVYTEARP